MKRKSVTARYREMKKLVFLIGAAGMALLAGGFAAAQSAASTQASTPAASQSSGSSEQTIEELYLNNVAMRIVREQATDLDRDSKLLALTSIQDMIDNGTLTKSSPVVDDVLGYLAFEGTARQAMQNNVQANNYPEVRRRACNLLGEVGGQESDQILMQVMLDDTEPMVLSEAAYALGQIGLNPDSTVSTRIADVVIRQTIVKPDNNFAFAALLAFEKLAKKNNGLSDPRAFQAIVQISQGNYILDVRLKAQQVLDELKQYG
jgi:HEAT repeats